MKNIIDYFTHFQKKAYNPTKSNRGNIYPLILFILYASIKPYKTTQVQSKMLKSFLDWQKCFHFWALTHKILLFGDGVEICDLKVSKGPHIWSKDGRCVCTTVDAFTVQHIANVATARTR